MGVLNLRTDVHLRRPPFHLQDSTQAAHRHADLSRDPGAPRMRSLEGESVLRPEQPQGHHAEPTVLRYPRLHGGGSGHRVRAGGAGRDGRQREPAEHVRRGEHRAGGSVVPDRLPHHPGDGVARRENPLPARLPEQVPRPGGNPCIWSVWSSAARRATRWRSITMSPDALRRPGPSTRLSCQSRIARPFRPALYCPHGGFHGEASR